MMKISVITPTYNRKHTLGKLYNSILNNLQCDIEIEWLIMDDGSTDGTEEYIQKFKEEKKFCIKYYKQENQGKMKAINNLVPYADSDFLVECDSDDYFTENAFKTIKNNCILKEKIYAYVFLKSNEKNEIIGNEFKSNNFKSKMFDLYYKQGISGDKALVYNTKIRKQYKYKIEEGENFSTEARLHHEMDGKYDVLCFNEVVMICKYQEDGYSKNIKNIFKKNPNGYFKFFEEMLKKDFSGVKWEKRIYIIKHYILFKYLSKQKMDLRKTSFVNKLLIFILYIPGIIKSYVKFE